MNSLAVGTFEVTMNPQPPHDVNEAASIARVSLEKRFSGDLQATSTGEMIGARSLLLKDSAGYVAIERVTGSLHGKNGSFVLQHSGTMRRGEAELSVTVVPDSGTGELQGIAGRMTIEITGGIHSYGFRYTFDDAP
ncbi:MAG TPA: DUF3224 domain-containing protein [Polyangiaceae bacterium]|nr:DUF3224 domain-containing protein [Polyangiaceae bacterium]